MTINKIIFIANSKISFTKYRERCSKHLVEQFKFQVKALTIRNLLEIIRINVKSTIVFTSDTKTNFLTLVFLSRHFLILNGFGRFERIFAFRYLKLSLLNFRPGVVIISQSYRDFRYLSINLKDKSRLHWIPGSGGVKRTIGDKDAPLIVTRNSKFRYLKDNFQEFIKSNFYSHQTKVNILGLSKIYVDRHIRSTGTVSQDDIFKNSSVFVQLDGYGEGTPHTLVDAICSNMTIIISKKCWIKYGFYKLHRRDRFKDEQFLKFGPSELNNIKNEVAEQNIFNRYTNLINTYYDI